MSYYVKIPLSQSTDGRGILVTEGSSTTSGTLLHTAVSGGGHDEVWLWAKRSPTVSITSSLITVLFGGTASGDIIKFRSVSGIVLLTPGLPLSSGVEVRAHMGTTSGNGHSIIGYINRLVTNA